ncbi:50S ribosomal protein L13 [Candidatus Kaiserbacteria bacterium RIFCSPLOWO2_01_FULL_53_17]|uniref:50S ribosomal protein L13 n=1 Tax=Candidatus Kaiserbacteria bacterium RIFCSPLOWO2_01_FULL_53_17 TaxID=1798511 RepID=A0A1F6EIB6_9BACT|nr:MAG: 50S ribosomal protein L13 [Candidatus Kaiserbacteria bacterium RIFCSPLOWO2_01_FULL_53_17]
MYKVYRMEQKQKQYTIDASGKTIGRVASEAAKALIGKTFPDYTPHIPSVVKVTVTNAKRIRMTEKKRLEKTYTHYSGHPGGLKKETLSSLIGRRGAGAAVRKAVERMLPRNTMRTARLKRLVVSE